MADPTRKPRSISWTRANLDVLAVPPPRAPVVRSSCRRCLAGDCDLCVRAGCYHAHDVRKHGLSVNSEGAEHGAPGPGRA